MFVPKDQRADAPRRFPSEGLLRYLRALTQPKGLIGGGLLLGLIAAAVLAPLLFPGGVDQQSRDSFLPPSLTHLFGTDELGRDIFVRCIYALQVSVSLVIVAVPLAAIAGTLMGLSGAVSRPLGESFQRLFDIILGFPSLVLGICIVIIVGPGWLSLVITIVIFSLPQFGRLARGALLSEESREYVLAARVLGVSKGKIMLRHILPNALDPIFVSRRTGAGRIVHFGRRREPGCLETRRRDGPCGLSRGDAEFGDFSVGPAQVDGYLGTPWRNGADPGSHGRGDP